MGHHAETQRTVKNFLLFTRKQYANNKLYIIFVTGEDNIARFDSRRYNLSAT